MLMSDLQRKDIINIITGERLGKIIDVEVNNEGIVNYLVVGEVKMMRRFKEVMDSKISFRQIKKIGTDVILVELN